MLQVLFLLLGPLILIAGVVAKARNDVRLMGFIIRRKYDEPEEKYMSRAFGSAMFLGIFLLVTMIILSSI